MQSTADTVSKVLNVKLLPICVVLLIDVGSVQELIILLLSTKVIILPSFETSNDLV